MSATKRSVFNVRLALDALEQVRALAEVETEGNASLMLRKLLSEALAARSSPPAGPAVRVAEELSAAKVVTGKPDGVVVRSLPVEPGSDLPVFRGAERSAQAQEDAPAGHPVRSEKTTAQILAERRAKRLGR